MGYYHINWLAGFLNGQQHINQGLFFVNDGSFALASYLTQLVAARWVKRFVSLTILQCSWEMPYHPCKVYYIFTYMNVFSLMVKLVGYLYRSSHGSVWCNDIFLTPDEQLAGCQLVGWNLWRTGTHGFHRFFWEVLGVFFQWMFINCVC